MELFEQGKVKLYRGDCMELMASYTDGYFDLAIVDPPYGIGAGDYKRGGTQHGNAIAKSKDYGSKDWDSNAPQIEYFFELVRVSRNQIIWGANHFISRMPYDSPSWIVWDKDNGNNGYADCELAYSSFKSACRKVKFKWHGMLQQDMKNKEERCHPTQKPIRLYQWLLDNYSKEEDKILDTHLGSGSSAIAAHYFGCEFTGIEIDQEYYDAAVKRFKENTKQQSLFAA